MLDAKFEGEQRAKILSSPSSICCLCQRQVDPIHEHHIIPQANGGKDGPTCFLCADHHNAVHFVATKLLAKIRRGSHVEFIWNYPGTDVDLSRYLVGQIVMSTLNNPVKTFKFTLKFNQEQRDQLEFLKTALNVTSIDAAIMRCVSIVFSSYKG